MCPPRSHARLSSVLAAMCALGMLWPGASHAADAASAIVAGGRFRADTDAIRANVDQGDYAGAEARLAALSPVSPFEKFVVASFRLELAGWRNDYRGQRDAVLAILGSGGAPADQIGRFSYFAGYLFAMLGDNSKAINYLVEARNRGEASPDLLFLLADTLGRAGRGGEALSVIDDAIRLENAAGRPVSEQWLDRAASFAGSQKQWACWASYEAQRLRAAGPGEWRTSLAYYLAAAGAPAETRIDILRLQAATGALASERDYETYATQAKAMGFALEAGTIIDMGRRTGKLTANNAAIAALAGAISTARATETRAVAALRQDRAPKITGAAAARAGDRLLSAGADSEAALYYRRALDSGTGIDRAWVQLHLGIALVRAGDIGSAMPIFDQIAGAGQAEAHASSSPQTSAAAATAPGGNEAPALARLWGSWARSRQSAQAAASAGAQPSS